MCQLGCPLHTFLHVVNKRGEVHNLEQIMKEVIIVGVLLICVCVVLCKDMCIRHGVNGCSTPLKMPFFYKERFTHACNRHDVCYRCGYKYRIAREECDEDFFRTMKKTCTYLRKRRSTYDFRSGHIVKRGLLRSLCEMFARGYYTVVKKFGRSDYRTFSPPYCRETWWVLPCLPRISDYSK